MGRAFRSLALGLAVGLPAGWSLVRALQRRRRGEARPVPDSEEGVVILQIDGLALPLLERAMAEGRMPALARWLEGGSHRLMPWECSLPSQTSASQAGILYGDNFDIPAFRWYEKETRHLLVSNHPEDAALIAQRHSTGNGLLSSGGTSVSNLVAGDAIHSLLTMSSFSESKASVPRRASTFLGFFLNPATLGRTFLLMFGELLRDLWEGQWQRLTNVRPRTRRTLATALLRSVSNVLLRELNVYLIRHDLAVGARVVYCDFVGYDEVAHHAGPERSDALKVLRGIDRAINALEQAAQHAPRPYRFVVLSDHGQSQGATFHERTGQTLEELLETLLGEDAHVHGVSGLGEGLGHLSAVLSELLRAGNVLGRFLPRLLGLSSLPGFIALSPGHKLPEGDLPPVISCGSGNLALVYFTEHPGRLSLETIEQAYGGVIEGLLKRREIGFILAHSDANGPVVFGRQGVHFLSPERVEGEDPLAPFGPHAAEALRRLDTFPHAGDLVLNSFLDPVTQEVAAFEELVGVHGGLGGLQTKPFVLFPASWDSPPHPLFGAPAVNEQLRRWLSAQAP